MKKIIKFFVVISLVLIYSGCGEQSLQKDPQNDIVPETFYKNAKEAVSAVNAAYAPLQALELYGRIIYFATDLLTEELVAQPGAEANWISLANFTTTPSNGTVADLWRGCYTGVLRSNVVLEQVPKIEMEAALKERILGEAHFLRALYYFHLVRFYGGVPKITTVPTKKDELYPSRASVEEIYELIISDLKLAETSLSPSYSGEDLGRATKGSAQGLLGKVYLYQASRTKSSSDYQLAYDKFKEITTSGLYDLMENYGDNFTSVKENNKESLFEVQYSTVINANLWGNGEGTHRAMELGVSGVTGWANALPTPALVARFGSDPRLKYTIFIEPDSLKTSSKDAAYTPYKASMTPNGLAVKKYQHTDRHENEIGLSSEINVRLIRYADVLLMMAEAANELGKQTEAVDLINQVRDRVGLAPVPVGSKDQVFEAIKDERYKELSLEEHLWFDLVRWGIAEEYLKARGKTNFQKGKHELFPIPIGEMDLNKNLTQNPGY